MLTGKNANGFDQYIIFDKNTITLCRNNENTTFYDHNQYQYVYQQQSVSDVHIILAILQQI